MVKQSKVYWLHIKDAIEQIFEYTKCGKKEFLSNKQVQDATIHRIQVIGEAVKKIPADEKHKYDHIPWKQIAGTRDKIVHDYFDVDIEMMWDVVEKELPRLLQAVNQALLP